MQEKNKNLRGKVWRHLVGAVITILCLAVFIRQVPLADVLQALGRFQWPYLVLGVCSLACGYLLRIVRWMIMLRAAGARVGLKDCSAPFLGSIAINNVLPLRLGDVVRALVFPSAMGINRVTATSSLVVERLVDLMTLLASLAVGLFAVQAIAIPAELKKLAVQLAVLGGAVLILGFLFSAAISRLLTRWATTPGRRAGAAAVASTAAGLLQGFNVMSRPRVLLATLAISLLIWAGECGLFYFVMIGLQIPATPPMALLVMSIATLSTLVPSSPGYVGPFHLATFTAVSLIGVDAAQAGSYAVLAHLALWLPTTLAGALAIWMRLDLFRNIRQQPA